MQLLYKTAIIREMLFTNQRSVSKTNGQITSQAPISTMPFGMGISRTRMPPRQIQPQPQPLVTQGPLSQIPVRTPMSLPSTQTGEPQPRPTLIRDKNAEPPQKKPMKWGEPTWFLFHTLAEKVKDEHFSRIRKELLDVIYTICVNLPCPTCAVHATQHMNGINYSTIQTKQQLKDMLFSFHNTVNARKQYPLFDYSELDAKYSAANTVHIIQNFMVHFQDKHASIHMIANDMHRARIATILKKWFNENIQYFNL